MARRYNAKEYCRLPIVNMNAAVNPGRTQSLIYSFSMELAIRVNKNTFQFHGITLRRTGCHGKARRESGVAISFRPIP